MKTPVLESPSAPPGRRMGRPTRAETERLDAHLLDIAERHFLAHGFEGTSMDRLALEARASKRTIYHRYAGKQALFEAVVERALERVLGAAVEAVEGATIEARLEHMAVDMMGRTLCPDILALMRVIIAEAGRFNELARALEERSLERLIGVIADQLRSEVATDRLHLAAPPEVAAEQFLSLTQTGLLMRALMGKDLGELRAGSADTVRAAIPLFLHGCCGAGPAGADAPAPAKRRPRATRP